MQTYLILPDPDELDSAHMTAASGWSANLYLVPAEETDGSNPRVAVHSGVGSIGEPEPAWHGRWRYIGSYQAPAIGARVRSVLERLSDTLIAYSYEYEGSSWNGSHWIGQWLRSDASPFEMNQFFEVEMEASDVHYWDADDWYGSADMSWSDLCDEAEIDPELALYSDWKEVARRVAEILEPQQDSPVRGTVDYATAQAESYRDLMMHGRWRYIKTGAAHV